MIKKFRLMVASMLSLVFMSSSVMTVAAAQYDISAYAEGPTFNSHTVELDSQCLFFGSASCEEGNMYGNPCYWKARQSGNLALTATASEASFGEGTSYTNIMGKSKMVTGGGTILNTYEKSANMFSFYTRANTRLYYVI